MTRTKLGPIIISIAAILIVWAIYSYRINIEAWAWHRQHGAFITVGRYVVPVPPNWFAENMDNGNHVLTRLDTDDRSSAKQLKSHAGILLLLDKPLTEKEIDILMSAELASLRKQGIGQTSQRTFAVDGEMISCINTRSEDPGLYDVKPMHWACRFPSGLQVIVGSTEPDMRQVWEVISGIHRKS
jgi:hypothetical protein